MKLRASFHREAMVLQPQAHFCIPSGFPILLTSNTRKARSTREAQVLPGSRACYSRHMLKDLPVLSPGSLCFSGPTVCLSVCEQLPGHGFLTVSPLDGLLIGQCITSEGYKPYAEVAGAVWELAGSVSVLRPLWV